MLFNSYVFILCFLPIVIVAYYGLNYFGRRKEALAFLTVASLYFYAYFNIYYLTIILFSVLFNYLFSRLLLAQSTESLFSKILLFINIFSNIALLFYFKYLDFLIENINVVFDKDFTLKNIVLPLGISFFTFQQISYVIDSKNHLTADYTFLEYLVFITFFPQLVAGPIVLHDELIPQFRDARKCKFNYDNFAHGLYLFILGLSKKLLIADVLGNVVNWGFESVPILTSADAYIVSLCYTFQIYFDFSGYCNMAHGIGLMFNIEFPHNFFSPYKATSVPEFWKCWHITLTRFFTKYVYIPLGGNRKGTIITYRNTFIVFLISGLWHGANWTFVIWGAMHGVAIILTKAFTKYWEKLSIVVRWFLTFNFINMTWIFFRAKSVEEAITFVRRIVGMEKTQLSQQLLDLFFLNDFNFIERLFMIPSPQAYMASIYVILILGFCFHLCLNHCNLYEKNFETTVPKAILSIFLLVVCIFSLSNVSTFLYFNF